MLLVYAAIYLAIFYITFFRGTGAWSLEFSTKQMDVNQQILIPAITSERDDINIFIYFYWNNLKVLLKNMEKILFIFFLGERTRSWVFGIWNSDYSEYY